MHGRSHAGYDFLKLRTRTGDGWHERDRSRTRHSQVTHYYFDDCIYYAPMRSDPLYASVAYRRLAGISIGLEIPNQCASHRVSGAFIDQVQYKVKNAGTMSP